MNAMHLVRSKCKRYICRKYLLCTGIIFSNPNSLKMIQFALFLGSDRATETFRENVGGGCRDRRERLSVPRSDGALHRL